MTSTAAHGCGDARRYTSAAHQHHIMHPPFNHGPASPVHFCDVCAASLLGHTFSRARHTSCSRINAAVLAVTVTPHWTLCHLKPCLLCTAETSSNASIIPLGSRCLTSLVKHTAAVNNKAVRRSSLLRQRCRRVTPRSTRLVRQHRSAGAPRSRCTLQRDLTGDANPLGLMQTAALLRCAEVRAGSVTMLRPQGLQKVGVRPLVWAEEP
jgi:hypothetical protein